MTDDEKYLFGGQERTIEAVQSYTKNNMKDIIAAGFNPKKTFIFTDYGYMGGQFYANVTRMAKHITLNVAQSVFGFDGSANIGRVHFGAIQGAPCFASSFPHIFGEDDSVTSKIPALIPCAIDQDPYFRVARDVTARLHQAKPALIHTRFLDALQGPGTKMSASIDASAIFMKDTPNQIKNKINKYAFSGGRETAEEQREKGGNADVDVAYQYLTYFLEDDEELAAIREAYVTGKMLTGELKAKCIAEIQTYVKEFQERRAKVDDEVVKDFMAKKAMDLGNFAQAAPKEVVVDMGEVKVGEKTKNQLKKEAKEKAIAEKKAAKEAAKSAT
jgi:tryptophanyl-tRNA synthetase